MSNALGCLLKLAGQVVPEVDFEYRVLVGKTTNEIGNQVATYGAWTKARGNVQPGLVHSFNARGVSDTGAIMKSLGFDQSKRIVSVFAYGLELKNIHDQDMPDQIRYHGCIYNIWSVSNWFNYDGWKSLVCIEDTREREPVVYKTEIVYGAQFVTNPTSAPFTVPDTYGSLNDRMTFYQPTLVMSRRTNGWYSGELHLNRQIKPQETVLYTCRSSEGFTWIWGTDE